MILSEMKPKDMACYITENMKLRTDAFAFVESILSLMAAHILIGDALYWNEVLKEL